MRRLFCGWKFFELFFKVFIYRVMNEDVLVFVGLCLERDGVRMLIRCRFVR